MKTQEWYFDNRTKTIRSMKNKYVLSIAGNGVGGPGANNMVVKYTDITQGFWY